MFLRFSLKFGIANDSREIYLTVQSSFDFPASHLPRIDLGAIQLKLLMRFHGLPFQIWVENIQNMLNFYLGFHVKLSWRL